MTTLSDPEAQTSAAPPSAAPADAVPAAASQEAGPAATAAPATSEDTDTPGASAGEAGAEAPPASEPIGTAQPAHDPYAWGAVPMMAEFTPRTAEELAYAESITPNEPDAIRDAIITGIRSIYDPEIPVNIHDLGLIYGIEISEERHVSIRMTLTSPMCPTAQGLVNQVEMTAQEAPHVKGVTVDLVWEPPWSMESMTEEARLLLGF